MGFVIVKEGEGHPEYGGKMVLHNNRFWFATNLAPPTVFETSEQAEVAIKNVEKGPKDKFRINELSPQR